MNRISIYCSYLRVDFFIFLFLIKFLRARLSDFNFNKIENFPRVFFNKLGE